MMPGTPSRRTGGAKRSALLEGGELGVGRGEPLLEPGHPGRVDRLPTAEDVSIPVQANLIIELCSK